MTYMRPTFLLVTAVLILYAASTAVAQSPNVASIMFSQETDSASVSHAILDHEEQAMNVLLGWSGASVASGAVMVFNKSRIVRDFGIQNIAWGVIDGVIVYFAKKSIAEKRLDPLFNPEEERRSFRNILLINTLLDVLYVGAGIWLANSGKEHLRGHGYGVIVQGSFLFFFDGINYLLAG